MLQVIRRDIARTYPEHDLFKEKDGVGQESLFNVMKAYSLHDREVGYCQGSGFIVGLLLMLVRPFSSIFLYAINPVIHPHCGFGVDTNLAVNIVVKNQPMLKHG